MSTPQSMNWQSAEVKSPHLDLPVSVVVARDIPYVQNANRLQNLSIYLPKTQENVDLVGQPITSLSRSGSQSTVPQWHVHVHGGAWRDPQLNSSSIEAEVAHAFSDKDTSRPITAIASINYTLSPFPMHPALPYDPVKDNHSDPAREAVHPQHIHDVLSAFTLLRSFGLTDGSYILSSHSCGACLAFQAVLFSPQHWGFDDLADPPRPAALLGMNGLYDLPNLVHGLGDSHAHLADVYENLQGIAFGTDESKWPAASPACVDVQQLTKRVQEGKAPLLVVLDQSTKDQLVPMNQTERMEAQLSKVPGLSVVRGHRCVGVHAAPWEEGYMIWDSIQDILKRLGSLKSVTNGEKIVQVSVKPVEVDGQVA